MRILIGILLLCTFSCTTTEVSSDGKYIDKIVRNVVSFEDGSELVLESCEECKTIYLIRHAEKDTLPKTNPILTEEGYIRANKLAQILKATRIDAVYSTMYNRTMHTVDSLISMKGLAIDIYQPKDLKMLSENLLSDSTFTNVLVTGHSNTTPGLAGALMGAKQFESAFRESDYDNLLVINKDAQGNKKLHKLRYRADQEL